MHTDVKRGITRNPGEDKRIYFFLIHAKYW